MILIDADALLKKTINNPLHVPYITKKDVIDMPSALNNQVNLCDSCTYTYPECPSEKDDVIFGNGIGNDNICACNKYQPTIQPVATDTNVGDTISRQAAIDAAIDAVDEWDGEHDRVRAKMIAEAVRKLPSAQPETAKRIVGKERDGMTLWYQCDMCDEPVDEQDNYCRGCGRRLIDG